MLSATRKTQVESVCDAVKYYLFAALLFIMANINLIFYTKLNAEYI